MIGPVARNRVMNLLHDRAALVLSFVLPIAFFSIFASIFAGSGRAATRRPRVAVADADASPASQRLIAALKAEPSLALLTAPSAEAGETPQPFTPESAERAVRVGQVSVALIIPKGFGETPIRFGPGAAGPKVLVLADTSDPVAPQMLAGLLQKAAMNAMPSAMARGGISEIDRWSGGLTPEQKAEMDRRLQELDRSVTAGGAGGSTGGGAGGLIAVETRDLLGEKKKNPSVALLASGLGVMFLLFSAAGAGGALIEEAESGTIDRILATRVTMGSLMGGKLLYLTGLAVSQLTLMFVWAALFFGLELPMARVPAVLLMTLATAIAASAFGLLLASICRSRMQLVALSNLLILGMSALGGSMFPRFLMPEKIQKLGLLTINGWSLEGFQRVFWREEGLRAVLPYAGVLVLLALLFFLAARRVARRWEAA
jgi:ABC-2 type transport system permease protein